MHKNNEESVVQLLQQGFAPAAANRRPIHAGEHTFAVDQILQELPLVGLAVR